MMIAAIEGQILFILIAAGVGIANLFLEKQKKKKEAEELEYRRKIALDSRKRQGSGEPIRPQSEEERLRKFLEALGVPTPTTNAPTPQRPAPLSPPSPSRQVHAPQVSRQPSQRQAPKRQKPIYQETPKPRSIVPPVVVSTPETPLESVTASQYAEPSTAIDQIRKSFDSDNMPSMPKSARTVENDKLVAGAYNIRDNNAVSANQINLLAALRSPHNLRTMILVKEILGPPPGLQS